MKRLDRVEVGRGLAALAIVAYHANSIVQMPRHAGRPPFASVATMGSVGVDFFFVLSGFILFHVHQKDFGVRGQLGRYAIKRAVRILPPYWIVTLCLVPAYLLWPGLGTGLELEPSRLLRSFLLIPQSPAPLLAVAWSLCNEAMFYAMFGLIVWRPRPGSALFVLWQLTVSATFFLGLPKHHVLQQWLNGLNLDFSLGMLGAWIVSHGVGPATRLALPVGGAAFLLLGAIAYLRVLSIPWDIFQLFFGICSMGIILGAASRDLEAGGRPCWILRLLGESSYSIYLVHYPLLSVLGKLMAWAGIQSWLSAEGWFLALGLLATLGGICFHLAVEKPVLQYCQRRWVPSAQLTPKPA